MAKQWGIVMVQKQRKTEEDVYQMIPTLRRRNMGILEKYSRLREELEMVWKTKATAVPVVIGALALDAVTPTTG